MQLIRTVIVLLLFASSMVRADNLKRMGTSAPNKSSKPITTIGKTQQLRLETNPNAKIARKGQGKFGLEVWVIPEQTESQEWKMASGKTIEGMLLKFNSQKVMLSTATNRLIIDRSSLSSDAQTILKQIEADAIAKENAENPLVGCPQCRGDGIFSFTTEGPGGRRIPFSSTCSVCDGTGKVRQKKAEACKRGKAQYEEWVRDNVQEN